MRRVLLVAVIGVGSLLTGCASTAASRAGGATSEAVRTSSVWSLSTLSATAPALSGSWVSSSLVGHDLVPGSVISVTFDGDRLLINAGCNAISGGHTVEAGRLTVDGLTQTEMGCAQALMDQDNWLVTFLSQRPDLSVEGNTLTLSGRGVVAESIVFAPKPVPPNSPLRDTTWLLTTISTADVASNVPAGVQPTISISGDTISMYAGCNGFRGPVVISDTALTVTEMTGTTMACDDQREAMEKVLKDAFTGTVAYILGGNQLTIAGADGTGLTFVAALGDPGATPPAEGPGATLPTATPPTADSGAGSTGPNLGTDVIAIPDATTLPRIDVSIPSVMEPGPPASR